MNVSKINKLNIKIDDINDNTNDSFKRIDNKYNILKDKITKFIQSSVESNKDDLLIKHKENIEKKEIELYEKIDTNYSSILTTIDNYDTSLNLKVEEASDNKNYDLLIDKYNNILNIKESIIDNINNKFKTENNNLILKCKKTPNNFNTNYYEESINNITDKNKDFIKLIKSNFNIIYDKTQEELNTEKSKQINFENNFMNILNETFNKL